MTGTWLHELAPLKTAVVRVTNVKASGSSPRGVGAGMTVSRDDFTGTVGGGALEFQALARARALLTGEDRAPGFREVHDVPLGPSLGQCCGGRVTLMYEVLSPTMHIGDVPDDAVIVRPLETSGAFDVVTDRHEDFDHWPLTVRRAVREMLSGTKVRDAVTLDGYFIEPVAAPKAPLFLYGAGHVGRAAVNVLAGLPFEVFWVDTSRARFPDPIPEGVECVVATDPAHVAAYAPAGAWHVVMTFSHALDLNVCRQAMARGDFAYLGVIASKTKKARFVRRLREEGISENVLARLHGPIGLAGIEGKEPATIAVSLAADLLVRLEAVRARASADNGTKLEGER